MPKGYYQDTKEKITEDVLKGVGGEGGETMGLLV
jgi:hypothetical protein